MKPPPYDPTLYAYDESLDRLSRSEFALRLRDARGLDRLRFIADPVMRRQLYDIYFSTQANERNPEVLAEIKRRQDEQRHQKRMNLAHRALNGKLGVEVQQAAERLLPFVPGTGQRQKDTVMLEQLARVVRELRHGPDEINDGFQSSLEPSHALP